MIDIKTKIITFTLLIITAISQANAQQPTQDSMANDIKYLEASFSKNYDSILTFYFNKRNTEHITNQHYCHEEMEQYITFDEIPDSVLYCQLNSIPAVIPMTYNSIVKSYIKMYVRRMSKNLNSILSLSEYYFPFFDQALERYNLPHELKYLPIIESALNPQAVSRVGATGLWQFMSGTGKLYGLTINSLVDERKDPLKSSDAAARYLRDLYNIFDDWHLAIASYNCGPKNVSKAIARSGGRTNFWEIYRFLPKETRGYIPAYIAATYIMTNYEKHNLRPDNIDIPIETDTLMIHHNLYFSQITKFVPIDDTQIKLLNPQYKEDIIPGAMQTCYLRLPMEYIPTFIRMQDSIFSSGMDSIMQQMVLNVKPIETITHTVKRNETLGKIAKRYGVTVNQLRNWNPKLKKNSMLKIGQKIIIQRSNPMYNKMIQQTQKILEQKDTATTAVVDTATVNVVADTMNYNIKTETKTKKTETPKQQPTTYTVKKGDTLGAIAKKYKTTVANIKKLNNLKSDKLKIGQKLRVK